jgi:hypothetical protein
VISALGKIKQTLRRNFEMSFYTSQTVISLGMGLFFGSFIHLLVLDELLFLMAVDARLLELRKREWD